MQARSIILADHSGTTQAETHSQRFHISGHCGGISSVTCCLWLVNTQCVFSPGTPNNREKISEHCMDMRVVLEGAHFFFFPSTNLRDARWTESGFCVIQQTNYSKCDRKKKKTARTPERIKNGGAQTNGAGSCTMWRGASVKHGRWNSEGNGKQIQPVICNMISNLLLALAMEKRYCFKIKHLKV